MNECGFVAVRATETHIDPKRERSDPDVGTGALG